MCVCVCEHRLQSYFKICAFFLPNILLSSWSSNLEGSFWSWLIWLQFLFPQPDLILQVSEFESNKTNCCRFNKELSPNTTVIWFHNLGMHQLVCWLQLLGAPDNWGDSGAARRYCIQYFCYLSLFTKTDPLKISIISWLIISADAIPACLQILHKSMFRSQSSVVVVDCLINWFFSDFFIRSKKWLM